MRRGLTSLRANNAGSVTVETALVLMIMISLTGAAVEGGYTFFQWNGAQEAARHGARMAATSPPVSKNLSSASGFPDTYSRICSGKTTSCNQGQYDSAVMNGILFGPDQDGICGKTTRERRGMCDVFSDVRLENVVIKYQESGLDTDDAPAPLITVTVTGIKYDFMFLDIFAGQDLAKMPDVSVTVMSEDLKAGA